ncbi:hypothetical protein BDR03DRAFT_706864 [Suillus americanus]|nr:hypothetical protein BDR03DRAFT_706864 [Suillus americanus]
MALLPFTLAAILLLSCIPFVCALPPPNCTNTATLDASDSPSRSHTRTLWDIIWSCVATLFACTWTAIYPNIPGMNEGRTTILFRRLYIMVLALITPELMVTWATIQFLSALTAAKDFAQPHWPLSMNSQHQSAPRDECCDFRGWTVTHGFFAWMGGFILYCGDKPQATLTPKELMDFVHDGYVDIPDIVEADIESRSKSDALSKGITILQLVWFVLQLVFHYIQHLPTTLLEIDTLAVVSLACIAYCLWWKKPQDIRRPYPVRWKPTTPLSSEKLAYKYTRKCSIHLEWLAKSSYRSHLSLEESYGHCHNHFSPYHPRTSGSVFRWL